MKYLLFPLGNFGDKYEYTRHNAGRFVFEKISNSSIFDDFLKDNLEVFIPKCYMNESGKYLKKFLKNKPFEKENIIIIYDDKDLEIGDIRLSIDRGHGGHNGLKDIIENLNAKDFWRIRVGIAPKGTGKEGLIPPHGDVVQEYVLGNLSKGEKDTLSQDETLKKVILFLFNIINKKTS